MSTTSDTLQTPTDDGYTGALFLLFAATLLAVYKPAGLTRREHRLRKRGRTTT